MLSRPTNDGYVLKVGVLGATARVCGWLVVCFLRGRKEGFPADHCAARVCFLAHLSESPLPPIHLFPSIPGGREVVKLVEGTLWHIGDPVVAFQVANLVQLPHRPGHLRREIPVFVQFQFRIGKHGPKQHVAQEVRSPLHAKRATGVSDSNNVTSSEQ